MNNEISRFGSYEADAKEEKRWGKGQADEGQNAKKVMIM